MRSKLIICLVALFWTGASLGNGRTNAIDSTFFDKICARLMEIPEVDRQLQVIGDVSNHTKGLFVHVDAKPGNRALGQDSWLLKGATEKSASLLSGHPTRWALGR